MTTALGCANYEVNTKRGDIPGYWIRYELQEADRAVEAARQAGKDKVCPEQFKAAEGAKDHAYDVFRSCRTEEGAALAKQATAKANALCPPQPARVVPEPVVVPPPAPPVPAPVPAPVAPSAKLTAVPDPVTKGESATLAWSSQNASRCTIEPGIGAVQVKGSMPVTPSDSTLYTLLCSGAGGQATSTANVTVIVPPPVVAVVPAARKLCSPTVIDIQFDTNKWDIKPQYHDELKKVGDFLVEFPNAKGTIEGHTDSVGNLADNMKLSQRRADSVRSYLIKTFGIAPERVNAKGYGPTKPVADNKTKEGKAKNRRTEANFTCD